MSTAGGGLSIKCEGDCGEGEGCFNPPALHIEILGVEFLINYCQCESIEEDLLFAPEDEADLPQRTQWTRGSSWHPNDLLADQVAADPMKDDAWLAKHSHIMEIADRPLRVGNPQAAWQLYLQETDSHLRSHILPLLKTEKLYELAESPDVPEQMSALLALGERPTPVSQIILEQHLSSPDAGVRLSAVYGLFATGIGHASPGARTSIVDMSFADPDPALRRHIRLLAAKLLP